MARPRNENPSRKVPVAAPPKMIAYLDAIAADGLYGYGRADVARVLILRGIEDLVKAGTIKAILGPVATGKTRA